MTAPSSSEKSLFRRYFLFRLREQAASLIICSVFALLALPTYIFYLYRSFGILYEEKITSSAYYDIVELLITLGAVGTLIMPVIGAAVSFVSCTRKKYTDMICGLPLSHKERFWGDFLSGYAAHVAPVIPAGIISIIISFSLQGVIGRLDVKLLPDAETAFMCVPFAVGMALSAFTALTIMYIVSTAAVVCCGRRVHAVIFSVISQTAPALFVFGVSCGLAFAITGLDRSDVWVAEAVRAYPPLGLLWDMTATNNVINGVDFTLVSSFSEIFWTKFAILNPLYMLYAALFAAGLLTAAYYLSKARRQERTGEALVHKGFFRVLSVAAGAGVALSVLAVLAQFWDLPLALLSAAFAAFAVMLLLEIVLGCSARGFAKMLLYWVGTVACCVGVYFLFDKTGAFGQRYINVSADKVESVSVKIRNYTPDDSHNGVYMSGEYEITDKAEIGELTEAYNAAMRENYGELAEGGTFGIDYTLTDGETIHRSLSWRQLGAIDPFVDGVFGLKSFPELQSGQILETECASCEARLEGVYGTITVPEDRLGEFLELFAGEVREKYYHAASSIGGVYFAAEPDMHETVWYPIAEDYTRTAEYLKSLYNETDHSDDTTLVMKIVYSGGDEVFSLTLNIFVKDIGDGDVKELLSLMKRRGTAIPDEACGAFEISSTDSRAYYIPEDAEQRAVELMMRIAEKNVE
ncbi:MAG: hypothetical protein NC299_04275 [Lachnospiraceae bacterium]|nr:hypothetical protein [Ruminococcus sp.]MCM1274564.1 hypothetical protein [Lachnospiraceae bacterium]